MRFLTTDGSGEDFRRCFARPLESQLNYANLNIAILPFSWYQFRKLLESILRSTWKVFPHECLDYLDCLIIAAIKTIGLDGNEIPWIVCLILKNPLDARQLAIKQKAREKSWMRTNTHKKQTGKNNHLHREINIFLHNKIRCLLERYRWFIIV